VAIRFGVSSTVKNRLPRYSNFWDGTAVYSPFSPTGSYDALATYTVGSGGLSTITFSGIPNTYAHLQIRGIARTAGTNERINLTFNSDTASNYSMHRLVGNGSAASASAQSSQSALWVSSGYDGVSNTANTFTAYVLDVLDYTSTSKTKTLRALDGLDKNGSGGIEFSSGGWFKTPEAINTISMSIQGGASFAQYSQFALYGIRG
jgi:hypothetical protein